jgi:uncharacterized lipoprotein YmbA
MRRLAPIVLLLALAGCATNPRHQLAVASQTVGYSLFALQDAEEAAYLARRCTGATTATCISPEKHQAFNAKLVVALELGKAFNQAVRTWDHSGPLPEQLAQLKAAVFALVTELSAGYPQDVQVQLLATLTATYDAILAVLAAAAS